MGLTWNRGEEMAERGPGGLCRFPETGRSGSLGTAPGREKLVLGGPRPLQSGRVGRETRGPPDLPPKDTRSLLPGRLQLLCLASYAALKKNPPLPLQSVVWDSCDFSGSRRLSLRPWKGHLRPPWLCPTDPARSSEARSPGFASLFDFSHGTFQEPESRGSAGQRAFVKRRAGEGHTPGGERRHPARGGARTGSWPRGARASPAGAGAAFRPGGRDGGYGFLSKGALWAREGCRDPGGGVGAARGYKGPLGPSPFARPQRPR